MKIKKCSHPDNCVRPSIKKELCELHYRRLLRTGELGSIETIRNQIPLEICKIEKCENKTWSKGYCNMHYKRYRKNTDLENPTANRKYIQDIEMDKKVCRMCLISKPLEFFTKDKKGRLGLNSKCMECVKYQAIYKNYGLSKEEYDSLMFEAKCKICLSKERLVIDHCHKTGDIRGILCGHCNTGIGMLKDNTKLLQSAISYLQEFDT